VCLNWCEHSPEKQANSQNRKNRFHILDLIKNRSYYSIIGMDDPNQSFMAETKRKFVKILGVPVDIVTFDQAQERIRGLLTRKGSVVFTPNSEILVSSVMDNQYRAVLSTADINLPDTAGLVLATLWTIRHRVPGADMAAWILRESEHKNYSVTLVIHRDGFSTVSEVREAVDRLAPGANVHVVATRGSVQGTKTLIKTIKSDIVLVGLGYPMQEYWIDSMRKSLPNVRLWMGIGGTVDYWTEKKPRAPKLFRKTGMEWLWRLLLQPTRLFRILKAVIVFPWFVYILQNKPLHQQK